MRWLAGNVQDIVADCILRNQFCQSATTNALGIPWTFAIYPVCNKGKLLALRG